MVQCQPINASRLPRSPHACQYSQYSLCRAVVKIFYDNKKLHSVVKRKVCVCKTMKIQPLQSFFVIFCKFHVELFTGSFTLVLLPTSGNPHNLADQCNACMLKIRLSCSSWTIFSPTWLRFFDSSFTISKSWTCDHLLFAFLYISLLFISFSRFSWKNRRIALWLECNGNTWEATICWKNPKKPQLHAAVAQRTETLAASLHAKWNQRHWVPGSYVCAAAGVASLTQFPS